MSQIQVFDFNGCELSTFVDEKGRDWFRGTQVCKILEIANPATVIKREADEYWQELQIGVGRPALYVSEPGLYALIFASKTPSAKKFQRWVFEEVLPKLRANGSYSVGATVSDEFDALPTTFDLASLPYPGFAIAEITVDTVDMALEALYRLRQYDDVNKRIRERLTAFMPQWYGDQYVTASGLHYTNRPRHSYTFRPGYGFDDIDQIFCKKMLDTSALNAARINAQIPNGVKVMQQPCYYLTAKPVDFLARS